MCGDHLAEEAGHFVVEESLRFETKPNQTKPRTDCDDALWTEYECVGVCVFVFGVVVQ